MTLALRVEHLRKDYVLKGETVHALRGVTFQVERGEYIAIMGPSGSGKSTLLNLLGCLDRPTAGSYHLGGRDVARLDDNALSDVRAANIGFVFQSYNLIPQLTVVENIEVPLYYQGRLNAANRRRCRELACMVGLRDRLNHRPTELSGGQQQRVAIARSLANDPYFILGRRADGQPGHGDQRRGPRSVPEAERPRQDDRPGHARKRRRRPLQTNPAAPRRPGRVRRAELSGWLALVQHQLRRGLDVTGCTGT